MYDKLKNLHMEMMVLDAGYKTPAIARELLKEGIQPLFPYKRPMTKEGFFKKYEYVYDEYTTTAISARQAGSLRIGQRTRMGTENIKVIRVIVRTVLIFPNVQKVKNTKKELQDMSGKNTWK